MGNVYNTNRSEVYKPEPQERPEPVPRNPDLTKLTFYNIYGHHIKLLEGQTKAAWKENQKGRIENVAFTSQPINPGETLKISFQKKGYVNIGVLHTDPQNMDVFDHEPIFTEILAKEYLHKTLCVVQCADQIKVCYGDMHETKEKNIKNKAEHSTDIWVFFEILHGDVEVTLKLLHDEKQIGFHSKHGEQIEFNNDRHTAYLKEGFLSVACIVQDPIQKNQTIRIYAPFFHHINGFVVFRFGILTQPPREIKNFSDLSKELRVPKNETEPTKIWFREAFIRKENYKGHFRLFWSNTGELKHNITEDCTDGIDVPLTDHMKPTWLLLELFQMEATVFIEPAMSRLVMVTGPKSIEKDNLKKLLEVELKQQNTVDKIVYGSSSNKVVVIFSDPVSPNFLEVSIGKRLFGYTFEPIKEPTVVEVQGIPNGKYNIHSVKVHFKNEATSGGTWAADFYGTPIAGSGFCFIDLKDPAVVKTVCERQHTIFGQTVSPVLPYYEELGRAIKLGENPIDLISEKLELTVTDEDMLTFINEKMEKELQHFMNTHHIRLIDQSLNSLTFSPVLMRTSSGGDETAMNIGPEWKTDVRKAFNDEFILELYVERLEIKDERKWKCLHESQEELCREIQVVNVYMDSTLRTFKFVSRKSDEDFLKSLKRKFESIELPEEFVTDISGGYNKLKLKAFEAIGFKTDVKSKTRIKIKINVNDGKLELKGLAKNIKEAKTKIMEKLGSLDVKSYPLPNPDYLEILKSPQLIEQGNREINKRNLRGIWEISSDSVNQAMVVCCEDSQKDTLEQIKELIFGLLDTDVIITEGEMEHTSLDGFKNKIREIEKSLEPFAKGDIQEHSKCIRITCRKDLMVDFRQQIQDLINLYVICTCKVSIKAATADYMHDHMISKITQCFQEACGEIPNWDFKDGKFHITGNQIVRLRCTEVLKNLSSTVIFTWRSIELTGIEKYFTSGAGKDFESEEANCRWKILTKHEFQAQRFRAIALTEDGQGLGISVMDHYNQPVDGIVNVVATDDLEKFRKGGEEVEKEILNYIDQNGKLAEGQVFVTSPGKLPCSMILHVRAPKWHGGMENEDRALRKTIENILAMAESKKIRSIAMPIVACRSMFGYPVKRASGIMLQTIISLCPSRFQSIREIYICDTDRSRIHELMILAEGMFGSQCFSIPMGKNLQLGKTIGPKLENKRKEHWTTIVERRGIRTIPLLGDRKVIIAWGDLAKLSECTPPLQADIIVNPSTTFPVLNGHIANGLKAAASNNGNFDLESECKKMEPTGGLQKGSFVATDTPSMSCAQILHLRVEGDWSNINEDILKGYIKSCMDYALSRRVKSIAFPTIGTGSIGYPRDVVAKCFIHAIAEFSQALTTQSLEKVIIVIYHRDNETTMAFEQELINLFAKRPHRLIANVEEEEVMEDEDKEEEEKETKEKKKMNKKYSPASSYSSPAYSMPGSSILVGTFPLRNGGCLTLKYGSLEDSRAAVLVSPTSAVPKLYGVIPSAIKKAAGGTIIEDELKRICGKGISVGHIAITGAGHIPEAKNIYHLKLEDFNPQKGSQVYLIYNSVKLCLNQADRDALPSIAFPTIGTGGFHWPPQLVANETYQAVESYFSSRQISSPLHITIMIFMKNSPEDKVFQTTANTKFGQGGPSSSKMVGSSDWDQASTATYLNIKVELRPGKLEETKADVIVNTTSSFPKLYGVIAQSLSKVAGSSLQSECYNNYPNGMKYGTVASTSGGNLNCTKVFHIMLSEWNQDNGKSVVHGYVTKCLDMLHSDGLQSIAFPTIGTGNFNYPAKDVASTMFESIRQFGEKNLGYKVHVTVVLYPTANDVSQAFKNVFCQTFQDVHRDLGGTKMKKVQFADDNQDNDKSARLFTAKRTNIDPEKRDFVLVKFISDSKEKMESAYQSIKAKVERDFPRHEPLKHSVIGDLREYDIQVIETKCTKFYVKVEVSKSTNEILFWGTSENVMKANKEVLEILTARHEFLQKNNLGKLMKYYYEWCYEEKENILLPYPQSIGIDLENAFIQHQKTYEFEEDGLKYCVDFSKFVEFQVGKESNIVKVVRKDRTTGDIQPLPAEWKKMEKTNLEVVELNSTDKEYLAVEVNFKGTLGSFPIKKIHKINRIQNSTLYQQYAVKKKLIQEQNKNLQSVEMMLWHGTAEEHTDRINLSGFNRSFAGQTHGNVWYGKGVYFSTRSEYGCVDNYTKRNAKGHKYMYQCKVLTGNSTVVVKGYDKKFPPDDSTTGRKFDSTSDPQKVEYVIFSDTQAYPEYLIEFE
ncbi:hypothetical protein CHS0354_024455 [Potamilus streckersoni]|uniref:Poly [ADP-ribose] polymerase n=1 Tax=Potamilus streckersoni TaxID=2493646 RepID=A0AAE0TL96_9BIVA|nr:hypothetical protein CHS0354_024455 [Potamilus streckersoni]